MTEDDLIESGFYRFWAGLRVRLEERCTNLQSILDSYFDETHYAGIGDDIASQKPVDIDLTGYQDQLPYTITLNPTKSAVAVLDQFDNEAKGLIMTMAELSSQYKIITGGASIKWVRPLTARLVLPPTTEELIKFSGMTGGFHNGYAIEHPVVWIGGRVIVDRPMVQ